MSYEMSNANLTLGMQLLEDNRTVLKLLTQEISLNNLMAYEALVHRMDCLLASFRDRMNLEIYDPEKDKMQTFKGYQAAMKKIHEELQSAKGSVNDKESRLEYIKWLNHWSQLHFSCYENLKLQPLRSQGGADQSLLNDDGEEYGE